MICHQAGYDGHPLLDVTDKDRGDLTKWKPETPDGRDEWSARAHADVELVNGPDPGKAPAKRETRKEWRGKIWGTSKTQPRGE
jgi:hypothetical protein